MALVDDIITLLTTAASDGVTHGNQATTEASTATTTPDTPAGNCLEGFGVLDGARDKAFVSHEEAGKAEGLLTILNELKTLGLPGLTPTAAQITDATTKRDNAVNAASAADPAIAAAEPVVLQNYVRCLGPVASAGLVTCLNDAMAAVATATTAVTASDGFGPGNLASIVQHLIDRATTQPLSFPGCNEGLDVLAGAAALINTAAAKLADLQSCLNRPDANPALPLVGQALTRLTNAQDLVNQARGMLDPSNVGVQRAWANRFLCRVQTKPIAVHVTDESGDNMGVGVSVSVFHPLIEAIKFSPLPFPPGALPDLNPLTTNQSSRVTFNIPLPPFPDDDQHPGPPAGAPPAPAGLPTADFVNLTFNASHHDRPPGGPSDAGITHDGLLGISEVQIPVPATSL